MTDHKPDPYTRPDVQPSTRHTTVADLPEAMQRRIQRNITRAARALLWGIPTRRRAKRWPW